MGLCDYDNSWVSWDIDLVTLLRATSFFKHSIVDQSIDVSENRYTHRRVSTKVSIGTTQIRSIHSFEFRIISDRPHSNPSGCYKKLGAHNTKRLESSAMVALRSNSSLDTSQNTYTRFHISEIVFDLPALCTRVLQTNHSTEIP